MSGGHLAAFETEAEFNAIHDSQLTRGTRFYFGLIDQDVEGNYVWVHNNQPVGNYQPWGNGEPNTDPTGREREDCIAFSNPDRGWRDIYCPTLLNFICEYP